MTSYGKDGRTEPASILLAGPDVDCPEEPAPPPRLTPIAVTPAHELAIRAEMAWRAMCTMHALELLQCPGFVRTGRITTRQVHQIAQDHLALRRPADDLDATVQAVLNRADELAIAKGIAS